MEQTGLGDICVSDCVAIMFVFVLWQAHHVFATGADAGGGETLQFDQNGQKGNGGGWEIGARRDASVGGSVGIIEIAEMRLLSYPLSHASKQLRSLATHPRFHC